MHVIRMFARGPEVTCAFKEGNPSKIYTSMGAPFVMCSMAPSIQLGMPATGLESG